MTAIHPPLLVLQAALDRRLPVTDRAAIDAHVAGCEACGRQVQILRWTRVRLAGLGSTTGVPPTLEGELRRALSEAAARAAAPARPAPPAVSARWWQRMARWRSGA